MVWIEMLGWLAAALNLCAYGVKTMLPLRMLAVASSLCFLVYSVVNSIYPTMMMHLLLLPLNSARLFQLLIQYRKARRAWQEEGTLDWLRPLLRPTYLADGDYVFHKGDAPEYLYYLDVGSVELEEIGVVLEAGELFGEIAFFTDARERTLSARCRGSCQIMRINENDFMRLYYQNPAFGVFLT
ncbi:cyclic nucleotide-binding domain-containing protein [Halomonas sp. NO4]|uniref:cyclic nucleotide-binding domain-containing protein n=1 Tax=Halomonas sp. NO4 TaxID=2484813 RepID=UPI0013D1150B|nr:cyclic nucleotide-binding domain-containing protein [Halomonas sp. NO4]